MEEVQKVCRTERSISAKSEEGMATQSALSSLHLLVGTLAHSLRGHLTGLDGALYLIQSGRSRKDNARLEKGLAMLQRNLERLRHAVTHILYYARDREPVREPVSPETLAEDLAEAVGERLESSGVRFEREIAQDTGPIDVDRNALFSALLNVLVYAFGAASAPDQPMSSGRAAVRLLVRRTAEETVFTVEAQGRPLDPETKQNVLSPFLLVKMEDTGLGLFVANKILVAHGGKLEIDSPSGTGITLRARLPLIAPRADTEQADGASGPQTQ